MTTTAPATLPQKETVILPSTKGGGWTAITDSSFDGKAVTITNIGGNIVKIEKQSSDAAITTDGIPLAPASPRDTSALPTFTQVAGYLAYAYSEFGTKVRAEVFA